MSSLLHLAAKRLLWPGPDYGTRVRYELRHRLKQGEGVRTLDVGCGNGCMTIAAARKGGHALGISNQKDFLERAKTFRDKLGLPPMRCDFRFLDIKNLAQSNLGVFDQIILFEVLEHLMDDSKALKDCANLLKPNGWLHITVPNRDNHWHVEPLSATEDGGHVRHGYDFPSLETLLKKNGFDPVIREGVGKFGTIFGFLAVVNAQKLPGFVGQVAGVLLFFIAWPLVQILNLFPAKPWSLYVLAVKRVD